MKDILKQKSYLTDSTRVAAIDNMKALLIICVVLGHLLEVVSFDNSMFFYVLIYSFHMPAFAFLSGICCSNVHLPTKITKVYIYPYIVFQTIYILFYRYVLKQEIKMQFTIPTWILWYLLALIIWHMVIPFFFTNSKKNKVIFLVVACATALLVGKDENVLNFLSFSRVVVLFPFFLGGFYYKDSLKKFFSKKCEKNIFNIVIRVASIISVIIAGVYLFKKQDTMEISWFYHLYPYEACDYNIMIRLKLLIIAVLFIVFLCLFVPKCKIPIVSQIGQNTMPVFLIHGLVIQYMKNNSQYVCYTHPISWMIVVCILMVVIFSSKPIRILLSPLLQYPFDFNKDRKHDRNC